MQQDGDPVLVAEALVLRQALFPEAFGEIELTGEVRAAAERSQSAGAQERRLVVCALQKRTEPAHALGGVAQHPELLQRDEEFETEADLVALERPGQRRAHVRRLGNHDLWPLLAGDERSEERRVGKECRSRWSPYH